MPELTQQRLIITSRLPSSFGQKTFQQIPRQNDRTADDSGALLKQLRKNTPPARQMLEKNAIQVKKRQTKIKLMCNAHG
jgi:hypothetical protein